MAYHFHAEKPRYQYFCIRFFWRLPTESLIYLFIYLYDVLMLRKDMHWRFKIFWSPTGLNLEEIGENLDE